VICVLILANIFVVTTTTTVHAGPLPKQTIYVDTSAIDDRKDLTDLQKAALKGYILGDIKGNFGVKVGSDNVEVTDDKAKKATADRVVDVKAGRDPSPKPSWGDWPNGDKSVNVYLGEFMDDPDVADAFKTGGNWDTDKLGKAIGHTSGHEVGHSYSIGHNNKTGADRSKMTKGNNIPATDRANTLFNFDEHRANVLNSNWGKPPCKTAPDYDFKVLVTHYWGEPNLPNKPCEPGALDTLFAFSGSSAWLYDFGFLGEDTDGGLYDGNSRFDFISKSSMFGNDTDAEMITFFTGAQDYSQFVLRRRDSGQWYILQEQYLTLDDFIANPGGLAVARLVTMFWAEVGINISLDTLAYGSSSNSYNGFTYEKIAYLQADRVGEPKDLDPAWIYDIVSPEFLMDVYDRLLSLNRTNVDTYSPRLARSWYFTTIDEMSPEGLHWVQRLTFTIRDNVHFQYYDGSIPGEGEILTPQDVERTFERLLITDAATGPSWMVWEPLFEAGWAGDLDAMLTGLGWPVNATTGWNTKFDEATDHAIESDATTVWFNLVMPYEPILQILSQSLGSIVNQAWCVWHGDWPGPVVGDNWYLWHDPVTSPLYSSDPSSPGPNLDAALGTGPYMLDYWNKGAGGAWSIIKNPNYWEGWAITTHVGWGPSEPAIGGHVDRYTSNYIPEWSTRKLRFLGGLTDFCDVPRQYMDQVNGQPGVRCIYPLPQLAAHACFFNFAVNTSSTHMGVMQAPGTFSQYGAPPNIMEDLSFRRALTHMFDYATYLQDAFLNESVSPVTPVIPGLPYYDPSIGQKEDPSVAQKKKYGITGEPAGQLAYDLALAKTYLQAAWGGQLWANGFTMDAVYNGGNVARQIAATLMKNAFDWVNANYGTKFTIKVTNIPSNTYNTETRNRAMPYFIGGWLPDFPDPHDFVCPFMHSYGDFSGYQGYLGATSFPNAVVDSHIDAGIATTVPSERQGNYTWLQHYYVDNAPGFVLSQPTGRHWERDWVQGWYYNPIYPGNYVYDLWKAVSGTPVNVDVAVTSLDCPTEIHITDITVNNTIIIVPSPISVTVTRLDTTGPASIVVVIGVGLQDESGRDIVLDTYTTTLVNTGSDTYTAYFYSFKQDTGAPILSGKYKVFAEVLVQSGYATDADPSNNRIDQAPISINAGDCNLDGSCDMADISMCIDAFMATPFLPGWNVKCDTNRDKSIDMADISTCIDVFMIVYPFP
jgi:peptide/nickel transport system substrate-binding protein